MFLISNKTQNDENSLEACFCVPVKSMKHIRFLKNVWNKIISKCFASLSNNASVKFSKTFCSQKYSFHVNEKNLMTRNVGLKSHSVYHETIMKSITLLKNVYEKTISNCFAKCIIRYLLFCC